VLNLKLSNSIKPHLNSSSIDCLVLYALNLTSLDTLDLRMPCAEAVDLLFTNRP